MIYLFDNVINWNNCCISLSIQNLNLGAAAPWCVPIFLDEVSCKVNPRDIHINKNLGVPVQYGLWEVRLSCKIFQAQI